MSPCHVMRHQSCQSWQGPFFLLYIDVAMKLLLLLLLLSLLLMMRTLRLHG